MDLLVVIRSRSRKGENAAALVLSRVFVSKSAFTEKRKNIYLHRYIFGLAEIKVIFKVLVKEKFAKEKRFSLQTFFCMSYCLKSEIIENNRNKYRTNIPNLFLFFSVSEHEVHI